MNINGKSYNKPEQNPSRAGSCSSVESTNSYGPTNNIHQPLASHYSVSFIICI